MSDTSKNTSNPLESSPPNKYEEAYYTDSEAQALYDTYLMLRDYGVNAKDLKYLAFAISQTTIYNGTDPEKLHQMKLE